MRLWFIPSYGSWASRRIENWSRGLLKSSYTSSRLVFKIYLSDICEDVLQTIFQLFYQCFEDIPVVVLTTWILVLKDVLNLGCKTSRILVLGTLKIRLQSDGSINVFKSSYPSWIPVLKTGLQDIFKIHFCQLGTSWSVHTKNFSLR